MLTCGFHISPIKVTKSSGKIVIEAPKRDHESERNVAISLEQWTKSEVFSINASMGEIVALHKLNHC